MGAILTIIAVFIGVFCAFIVASLLDHFIFSLGANRALDNLKRMREESEARRND